MKTSLKPALKGAAIVLAAAGLAACNSPNTNTTASAAQSGTVELAHCYGVNVCKGHNDCGTATNSCSGQASCKGTGFVGMPTKACADVGGKVKDDWRGQITKAELTQCYEVNVCKGHNDCKTADNSCAGHASCKGTGFVLTTEKSCADIGGKSS